MSNQTALSTNGAQKPSAMMVLTNRGAKQNDRVNALERILNDSRDKILSALPKHISADRMIRLVLSEIRKTPKLLECTPESLFAAIGQAAQLGLQTDGVLGHAYLIPYGSTAQLIPGYRGLLDLARRYDKLIISTNCVYRQDSFSYAKGDNEHISHMPYQGSDYDTSDDAVTHVYLIAKDRDGVVVARSVWTKAQVDQHKIKYSKGWSLAEGKRKDSPWHTNWQAMARKTLIRDAIARGEIPVSAEIQNLAVQEEIIEAEVIRKHTSAALPAPQSADDLNAIIEGQFNQGGTDAGEASAQQVVPVEESPMQGAAESSSDYKNRIIRIAKSCDDAEKLKSLGTHISASYDAGTLTDEDAMEIQTFCADKLQQLTA